MKRVWSVCAIALIVAGMYLCAEKVENTKERREDHASAESCEESGWKKQRFIRGLWKGMVVSTKNTADAGKTENVDTGTANSAGYACVKTADGYQLTLYDGSGHRVYQDVFPREPQIMRVKENLLEISISVGSPASYVFWFDTKEARLSDTYFNPILVGDSHVAYMEDHEELLLRALFDEGLPETRIRRDFSRTADLMSAIMEVEMADSENIILTYLEGADYTEVSETIKIEKPYVLKEEEKRILLAYAKYLQKIYEEYPYGTERIRYDLVFIDIDNIPELAIIPSDAHAAAVTICVYNGGNVTEAGSFGSFGKCRFTPYENLIFSTYMGQGEEESLFYRIDGTESVKLLALHSVPQYDDFRYIGDHHEVNGVEVFEEEYLRVCEEWDWEELDVLGYDDAVPINDIDDLYREMCRRFSVVKEQEHTAWDDSCLEEWKQAYLDHLEAYESADTWTYSLICVDDDEIPELVCNTGFEAGGVEILTFHDHVLDVWQSARLNVTYIEGRNLICNSDGNMDHYYDHIYTIQDGKWVYVDGGTYGNGSDGIQLDENENLIYVYNWGGESVDKEEYQVRLNAVYPEEQGMRPQQYYILDEIISLLRTGDVASSGHRYELIVEDVTWKEARRLCQERGGHLATVTSREELERLQERIIAEDKENVTFFVGATRENAGDIPFGYRWLEPGSKDGYNMLMLYNALFRYWLEGEPSYTGVTEDGREVREGYVVLFYRRSDGRCYLNDVPDDILDAAPSYAGRVGYICEYE
ncbi:MAG: C-type lectin domain-containing protein [Lachnospiraceae bacterium]|nr:C-type lectin domain-containing protein [Butyrivibrio sp.]MCM1343256.1 C-type lectin domain-containing protein [Muribaculaceae bacterium]MCM1412435.1 C-type lectin domain-containing protein [Lachnospiraceae bacterium]